jgi:hypothetical protein
MGLFSDLLANLVGNEIKAAEYTDEAIYEAFDMMWEMCGNEGQESILEQGAAGFENWAVGCMRNPDRGCSYDRFMEKVGEPLGDEKYLATDEIWNAGQDLIIHYAEEAREGGGE